MTELKRMQDIVSEFSKRHRKEASNFYLDDGQFQPSDEWIDIDNVFQLLDLQAQKIVELETQTKKMRGSSLKSMIAWTDAPKRTGMVLVGHSYASNKKPGHFGKWVYITRDGTLISFRSSPYFTPTSVNLKKKRFIRFGEKAEVK